MPILLCPCGHDWQIHKQIEYPLFEDDCGCGEPGCECKLTPDESLRAAQRSAAIAHLRGIGKNITDRRRGEYVPEWYA